MFYSFSFQYFLPRLFSQKNQLEHQLGAYTNCNHGCGLAVIHPVYYRHVYKEGLPKFVRFAENVWSIARNGKTDEELALAGIEALADFRRAKESGDASAMQIARSSLEKNMPYFGYGYIGEPSELVPHVGTMFWAFRVMVGLGMYFILFFLLVLFFAWKHKLAQVGWLHVAALWSIPLAYIASHAGWIVAEVGRQPWTIQDMLPVGAAVSRLETGAVQTTFLIFLVMFTVLLVAEVGIMVKAVKKGPETAVAPEAESNG